MEPAHDELAAELSALGTMARVVPWAAARVPKGEFTGAIAQDEFTHDVVVRLGERTYAVFDTT